MNMQNNWLSGSVEHPSAPIFKFPVFGRSVAACTLWALVAFAGVAYNGLSAQDEMVEPSQSEPIRVAEALRVFPNEITLDSKRDFQSIVAQLVYSDGITTDVTAEVSIEIVNPQVIAVRERTIIPLRDGETTLKATYQSFEVEIPVRVSQADAVPAISFKNDVIPVLSKTGCNAGSCHGSARGKDGFQLSLYGFDPAGDYHRLTREMLGRRIDLAIPDDCLLINKATGEVPHSGGTLFSRDSAYYQTMLEWLETGALKDQGEVPKVVSVDLYPQAGVLNGLGAIQQLTVLARYSDGATRDVTPLAYFSTSNDNSAIVSQAGVVEAQNRGEAFVMARFETHTVGSDFIVLPKDARFEWRAVPENNYIDMQIHEKLKTLRIQPSELCTDAEFIRRVSIDICGILPEPDEVKSFVEDQSPAKRAELIDRLLERKEFVEIWVMKWSELLQVRSNQFVSYKSTLLYYDWLRSRIANDVPINVMVQELLSAQGGTFSEPATNYYQTEQDNLKLSENVAQVFLGMRLQCAQCHNHPFDRWTMDDYYGFAAFFAQVARKTGEDPRETIVFNRGSGETQHPVTKQPAPPKFLGGEVPNLAGRDRRAVLGEWIASPDNPYFAKNLANIVWAHFFGRGIVHEVDDVRVSNPAVNADLLNELAEKLKSYNYDFKSLVRDICNSRTYQLSTTTNSTNETDLTNFSHATLRRVRAEVLLDLITQVTSTQNKFAGLPLGARAVQIADGNTSTYFLTTFGRARRDTVCSCEVKVEPNMSQALHLLNGETVHRKIADGKLVQTRLEEGRTGAEVIEELFSRCLSRRPTEAELESLLSEIAAQENQQQALEDIFWAILNSSEFLFNH
jgi:hypothetical protein